MKTSVQTRAPVPETLKPQSGTVGPCLEAIWPPLLKWSSFRAKQGSGIEVGTGGNYGLRVF